MEPGSGGCERADICREECKSSTHKKATNGTPDGKMPAESGCSPREIQKYLGKIRGPLLDRIDIHVEVPQVKFREIAESRMVKARRRFVSASLLLGNDNTHGSTANHV